MQIEFGIEIVEARTELDAAQHQADETLFPNQRRWSCCQQPPRALRVRRAFVEIHSEICFGHATSLSGVPA